MVEPSRFFPRTGTANSADLTRRRVVLSAAAGAFGAVVLTACSSSEQPSGGASPASPRTPSPSEPPFTPTISVEPARDAVEVNPVAPVVVSTEQGRFAEVQLLGPEGTVAGSLSEDGRRWEATAPRRFDTQYQLKMAVVDPGNSSRRVEDSFTFTTTSPAMQADATFNIVDGQTYGTGQIIQIRFSEPVLNRGEVEKALTVSGAGNQPGKVRWYSDHMMRYRPEDKWAPNSAVQVSLQLRGVNLGNGMIGNQNYDLRFLTGNKHYAVVDNRDKIMRTFINDQPGPEYYVTLGNEEWPSVIGQLVIIEQHQKYKFDPRSIGLTRGDPHWYDPFYAHNTSRLTFGGVFVHQALPSAMPVLGKANVSHGCIGMPPEGARFIYETFRPGDVIETLNTGYLQADPDDGYGDWNIPFEHYDNSSWKGNW